MVASIQVRCKIMNTRNATRSSWNVFSLVKKKVTGESEAHSTPSNEEITERPEFGCCERFTLNTLL